MSNTPKYWTWFISSLNQNVTLTCFAPNCLMMWIVFGWRNGLFAGAMRVRFSKFCGDSKQGSDEGVHQTAVGSQAMVGSDGPRCFFGSGVVRGSCFQEKGSDEIFHLTPDLREQ